MSNSPDSPDGGAPDRGPQELVPDEWRHFDDTLADGPSPAQVPDVAKEWLAQQRVMHGLLRALHTADASSRESRITRLLEQIDREPAGVPAEATAPEAAKSEGRVLRGYWALVGIAAMLVATITIWFALPTQLPTAEAAVNRIVNEMQRDVDRRYRVDFRALAKGEEQAHHVFSLVTRPGMRFRVDGKFEFRGQKLNDLRVGCDGEELWVLPNNSWFRRAAPLADAERLLEKLGDVLDIGYLDVHALIAKLPADFKVRVVGREAGADGRKLLRIEANAKPDWLGRMRKAWLLCDEESGMVHHVGVHGTGMLGFERTLTLDYLGQEPDGLVDYSKPW